MSAAAPDAPDEPWRWEESEWRRRVGLVRAGRSLKPARWPEGKRCAVALSFDSDHETNEPRDGGRSIGRLSWGEYRARVGAPRILRLLREHEIPATFFVPAVSALLHPDEQREVIAQGHEIGLHGWIHEVNTAPPPENERELGLLYDSSLMADDGPYELLDEGGSTASSSFRSNGFATTRSIST